MDLVNDLKFKILWDLASGDKDFFEIKGKLIYFILNKWNFFILNPYVIKIWWFWRESNPQGGDFSPGRFRVYCLPPFSHRTIYNICPFS